MVKAQYANYNKYFRQLQTHPDIEYLLTHFVTPSSVVFIWNRISLVLKGCRFTDLEWNDVFGCDMPDRVTSIRREDIDHLTIIQQEGEDDSFPGGELVPCFSLRSKPVNVYYVISTNEASLGCVYGTGKEGELPEETPPSLPVFTLDTKLPLTRSIGHNPSHSILSHCSSPVMIRPSFSRNDDLHHSSAFYVPSPLGLRTSSLAPFSNEWMEETTSVSSDSPSIPLYQEFERRNSATEGRSVLESSRNRVRSPLVSME